MEYYDSINKTELHSFYLEKSNKLLTNEKVTEVLDKKRINFKEENDIKLFKTNPYQIVKGERKKSVDDKLKPTGGLFEDITLKQYRHSVVLHKQLSSSDLKFIVKYLF